MADSCFTVCAFATQMPAEEVAWVIDWGGMGKKLVLGNRGGLGVKSGREDCVTCGWYWQCNV